MFLSFLLLVSYLIFDFFDIAHKQKSKNNLQKLNEKDEELIFSIILDYV